MPFKKWAESVKVESQTILEPFAGAKHIQHLMRSADFVSQSWEFFDIEPGAEGIKIRDTLTDFPKDYEVCITNPPWLARNSATRRGLPFPNETHHDDLYKYALEQCLNHCNWVAAIIPEAFIRSGLFQGRLSDFVSLVPQDSDGETTSENDRSPDYMFIDTEHPVGLAIFAPHETTDVRLWRNNQPLGKLTELSKHLPQQSKNRRIVFNEPAGNLGLIAIDNTVSASIRFCHPSELGDYKVRTHCRSITRIAVPWEVNISKLNSRLAEIRDNTHDVYLTAFKGLRRDGYYRRRLDWGLARAIIDEVS